MNRAAEDIRREVSEAYAERLARVTTQACCGGGAAPEDAVVTLGGYSGEERASLPEGAAGSSFGCGNPLALAGLRPGDVVVDLGSGAGVDLLLAARRVGPSGRAIGVDMTDAMIARARENLRAAGVTNAEVRKGVIEDLPVESASVDWIISNCVINLSPEKPRVFREIARVLKPGGQLLVSDIVAHDLPSELRAIPWFYASCVGGAIGEDEYLAGLRAAGLVDVAVRDRLVYDAEQIAAFASEACGCGAEGQRLPPGIERTLAGKVWSAKVYARKPR